MKRILTITALASPALLVLFFAVGMVHAQEKPRFARATESEGDVWVIRVGEDEWDPCGVNTPLGESDLVETEDDSYAEFQFDDGLILSLGGDTRVDFKKLSYDERGGRSTLLFIPFGSVRARVPAQRSPDDLFVMELPTGRLYVDFDSDVRVNVKGSKASEVIVYSGEATLEGKDGQKLVRGGQRAYLDSDGYHGPIGPIPRGADAFDNWCARTYEKYLSRESVGYLSRDGEYIGVYDLDYHGEWVMVSEYGYCWRPHSPAGWYPYCDGYWVHSHRWGWTWVSYEPWGWIPYHYGRWVHTWRWGWVWVPGPTWGPAWVVWVGYGDCIGWAPLCPWGYPCYCYEYGCYGPWTYVYRYSFYNPHGHYRHGWHGHGGKYRHFAWGEKRYKYRNGKDHNMAEFSVKGPKSREVAMKDFKPSREELTLMKEERSVSQESQSTISKERSQTGVISNKAQPGKPKAESVETRPAAVISNKTLPAKPRTRSVETRPAAQETRNERATQPARSSENLPAKPEKEEARTSETSYERAEVRRESAPAPEARRREDAEPRREVYDVRESRQDERRSEPAQRSEGQTSERAEEKKDRETERTQRVEVSRGTDRTSTQDRPAARGSERK